MFRSKTGDTPQAHAAADAGFALSRLYGLQSDGTYTLKAGSKVDDVLTPSALMKMRDNTPSGFKSNFYWPAQSTALPGDSIFLEPLLLTNPEDWLDAEFPNLPKSLD